MTAWSIWYVAESFAWPESNTGTDTTLVILNMIMTTMEWEDQ